MRVELIIIGDELLDGVLVDTHTSMIGQALAGIGLAVSQVTLLRDDLKALAAGIRAVADRADVCITTGGLGPTPDDLTVDALAEAAGVILHHDEETWVAIQARFAGLRISPSNMRQARVPDGGQLLATEVGTAPGVCLDVGACTFFCLPGVPRETRWHMDTHVLPALGERFPDRAAIHSRVLRFVCPESRLAELVEGVAWPEGVGVAWQTLPSENRLRLFGADPAALQVAVDLALERTEERFVGEGDKGLVATLLELMEARGLTLGAAESCTGGLVGALVTEVSGASSVFNGSIVSYSNSVKHGVLGVSWEILETHGAVSEPCALAMARGARAALGVDVAVSITGVAGPGGGTPEKPVGTVCFGWAGADLDLATTKHFTGDRDRIRQKAAAFALDVIRRRLSAR